MDGHRQLRATHTQQMIFFAQVLIQVLHVLEICALIRAQFPPGVLLLQHTKREDILIG